MTRQDHILVVIAEECSEIAKNATKALRFGLNDAAPETSATNGYLMLAELSDLLAGFEMLRAENGDFAATNRDMDHRRLMDTKIAKVETMLLYSQKQGRLE